MRDRRLADEVAGSRPCLDQAAGLEQVVGLEDGGRADAAVLARFADGRQAVSGAQLTRGDGGRQVIGKDFVALHEEGC